MDGYGIAICVIGGILYFATQRKYVIFAFISGIGAGILIGAIWAMAIVNRVLP